MLRTVECLINSFGPYRIIECSEVGSIIARYGDEYCGRTLKVNPDLGRHKFKYFKFLDAWMSYDVKKIARIDFRTPRYIFCKNRIGRRHWWLYSSEKEELMDFLNSKNHNIPNLTNWQVMILNFNLAKGGLTYDKTYENLLSDKFLKYPEYLPFDLKMPDYRKLPNN